MSHVIHDQTATNQIRIEEKEQRDMNAQIAAKNEQNAKDKAYSAAGGFGFTTFMMVAVHILVLAVSFVTVNIPMGAMTVISVLFCHVLLEIAKNVRRLALKTK